LAVAQEVLGLKLDDFTADYFTYDAQASAVAVEGAAINANYCNGVAFSH